MASRHIISVANLFRGLLRNHLLIVFAGTFGGQMAVAVTGPLMVRMLGVDARGELAVAYALILISSQIGMIGLPSAITVFIARDRLNARALLRKFGGAYTAIAFASAVALSLFAATGWLVGDTLPHGATLLPLLALGVVVFMWWLMVSAALLGEHRFRQYAIARTVSPLLMLIIIAVGFIAHASPTPLEILAVFIGTTLMGLVLAYMLLSPARRASTSDLSPEAQVSGRQLLHFGARATADSAGPIDGFSIDQLLIAAILTSHALGLYVIGYAFESLPVLLLITVANVAGPKLASIEEPVHRLNQVRKWLLLSIGLGAISCVGMDIILKPVLIFAFGQDAADALPIARVLVYGGFFLGMRRVFFVIARAYGRPSIANTAELIGLATLLVLAVPMTQHWGAIGTAWALSAAGLVACLIQVALLTPVIARSARTAPAPQFAPPATDVPVH
ncbi:MAG: oligosaccharide flippase family protein [Nocardiaceae bacterium]|nr:oligosaccharide flippase family protein [Nocardiaceae bacterium]